MRRGGQGEQKGLVQAPFLTVTPLHSRYSAGGGLLVPNPQLRAFWVALGKSPPVPELC